MRPDTLMTLLVPIVTVYVTKMYSIFAKDSLYFTNVNRFRFRIFINEITEITLRSFTDRYNSTDDLQTLNGTLQRKTGLSKTYTVRLIIWFTAVIPFVFG